MDSNSINAATEINLARKRARISPEREADQMGRLP
jgi:hypothetical protein